MDMGKEQRAETIKNYLLRIEKIGWLPNLGFVLIRKGGDENERERAARKEMKI